MMINKRELMQLKTLAYAPDCDSATRLEIIARIMTSRVDDPDTQADMTEFVRDVLHRVTKKHSAAKDTAARQLCWHIMTALAGIGERMIDEAPDGADEGVPS